MKSISPIHANNKLYTNQQNPKNSISSQTCPTPNHTPTFFSLSYSILEPHSHDLQHNSPKLPHTRHIHQNSIARCANQCVYTWNPEPRSIASRTINYELTNVPSSPLLLILAFSRTRKAFRWRPASRRRLPPRFPYLPAVIFHCGDFEMHARACVRCGLRSRDVCSKSWGSEKEKVYYCFFEIMVCTANERWENNLVKDLLKLIYNATADCKNPNNRCNYIIYCVQKYNIQRFQNKLWLKFSW